MGKKKFLVATGVVFIGYLTVLGLGGYDIYIKEKVQDAMRKASVRDCTFTPNNNSNGLIHSNIIPVNYHAIKKILKEGGSATCADFNNNKLPYIVREGKLTPAREAQE